MSAWWSRDLIHNLTMISAALGGVVERAVLVRSNARSNVTSNTKGNLPAFTGSVHRFFPPYTTYVIVKGRFWFDGV